MYSNIGLILMLLCSQFIAVAIVKADEGNKLKSIRQLVKEAHEGVTYISCDEMKERIKSNSKLVLVDVRTKGEHDAAHIKGSAWIERGVAEFVLVRTLPDPDAEIVVYCKKGNRSGLAIKALKNAGYRNVVGLEGGFDEWVNQGNSVYNALGEFKMVKPKAYDARSFPVRLHLKKN